MTTHYKETRRSKELDPEMAQISILTNRNFKVTMIKMLTNLVEWVNSTQKQMETCSRETETIKKSYTEINIRI